MKYYRTHNCGQLSDKNNGEKVILSGWVNSRRDHGDLIFIDLRDRFGITQIVFNPQKRESFNVADKCRSEYVIRIEGEVRLRPENMINEELNTGKIEIEVEKIDVLSESKTPPFEINDKKRTMANEELRLKYRFLDLRHKYYQDILMKRNEFIRYIRDYFNKRDFIEIQTPLLANSSPEGARDYLVPSRLYPGKFYALPQAPQQFKQLLMVAGMDKYFQIAPCFRDEDPRADRHPGDFYQLDFEMSFVEREDLYNIIEKLIIELTEKFSDKKIMHNPFPRISWDEAMNTYGSDKPDLRYDLPLIELTELFKNTNFKVFANAISQGGCVKALKVTGGSNFSRKQIDDLTEIAKSEGLGGLAYIIYKDSPASPILKFLSDREVEGIKNETKAKKGDIVFFGADNWLKVVKALGKVRTQVAVNNKLIDNKLIAWAWIYDFPMYSISDITGKLDFEHNPFSMPVGEEKAFEEKDATKIRSTQFDIVANGYEIGSGSIRNHRPELLYQAFELAGYKRSEVDKKFKHMVEAMKFGAPPHGGAAPGIDRMLMLIFGTNSIRDIYAFPKAGNAQDMMTGSPSEVSEAQLKELGIKINKK